MDTPHSLNELDRLNRENRRLKERLKEYEQLYQVLEVVSSSLEVGEVIERIIWEALQLCQADQGSLLLLDPGDHEEAKTLIRQGKQEEVNLDYFLNRILAGWVTRNRQSLVTTDIHGIVGKEFMKEQYRDITAVLSVPLILQEKAIGVLNLIRLSRKAGFRENEVQLITILATICGQFIQNAKLHSNIFTETLRLRKEVQNQFALQGIIGNSPQLKALFAILERVIPTEARVLIEGESGTGKELVARVIHYNGPRKENPFVTVDCGALPATLLEDELFGHVKGAFTGAHRDKKGLFEAANHGTLFLDEIINMPLDIQTTFLRAIQEGEIRPIGSTKIRQVDVRVIAAASSDLIQRIEEGNFRQDLYYRLNVVPLHLPPLRERKGDIAVLASHFLRGLSRNYQKSLKGFQPATLAFMEAYSWPGNVRELQNVIERMVILSDLQDEYLRPEVLPSEIRPEEAPTATATISQTCRDLIGKREAYEKMMLLEALTRHNWNQSSAARELGISERTVRYKMQKFNLKKPDARC